MRSSVDLDSVLGLPKAKAFASFTRVTSVLDPALLAKYRLLLSEDERRRHDAFRFGDDRHLYLVAHALLRTSLSRYSDVPPEAWTFTSHEFGRPELAANEPGNDRIRFNLSHTRGLAACAITRNVDIGIDVECLDRRVDSEAIAPRYFSQYETRQLARLSGAERESRFLEYWTLKEAYVKARGGGLSIPLDRFHFYDQAGAWRIAFDSEACDPDHWQFACLHPTPNHVMSIAIYRPGEPAYEIDVNEIVPLAVNS